MNREKYSDPTAEKAIANVMREEKKNHRNWDKFLADKTNMEEKMEKIICDKNKSVDKTLHEGML